MKANTLHPLDDRGWLSGQPPEFRAWMADRGRWQTFVAREVIYDVGDEPDGLYGLGEGALEVTLPLVGEEAVTLHRAEPGFWLGESALMASTARGVSLTAATDARVFRVPGAAIRALMAERPGAWRPFYELSHMNAMLALTLLAEALSLSPQARLSRVLLRLADADGRAVARQDELARLIGMTRSSLQRAMKVLSDRGAITGGYGCVVIRDRAALEALRDEA